MPPKSDKSYLPKGSQPRYGLNRFGLPKSNSRYPAFGFDERGVPVHNHDDSGRPVCGHRKKDGTACMSLSRGVGGRCRSAGGKTPIAEDSHSFIDGRKCATVKGRNAVIDKLLNHRLEPNDKTALDHAVETTVKQAKQGNLAAATYIIDQGGGRPESRITNVVANDLAFVAFGKALAKAKLPPDVIDSIIEDAGRMLIDGNDPASDPES